MPRHAPVAHIARWVVAVTLAAHPAWAQERDRFAARLELGAGSMLSTFQRNDDPRAFNGDAKGYGLGLHAALRFAWSVTDAFALQASLSNWGFPTSDGREAGWVFAPMLGARFEPALGSVGRAFVDGNVGIGMTGDERALQVDVGAGFEFLVSPSVSVGPVVRYGQTVQPDTRGDGQPDPYPDDARYLVGGLSLSLRTAPEPAAPSPVPIAAAAAPAAPRDTDGDGVPDSADLCPTTPPGERPDAFRPGCPVRDRDEDGVPDERDVCVSVVQGPDADPMRPGCPALDSDHDGVSDHADACPELGPGAIADPARPGCPDGDRDGDGYTDSRDRCPAQAETFNNITDEDGCPETQAPMVEIRSGMIQLQGNPVNFGPASDRIIGRRSFEILDALAAVLRAHAEIARVDIQGHTDDRGDRATNMELSARRARAVRTYLVDHGIDPERVEAHGFGPDRPVADNSRAEGRATNRRVEVHILNALPGAATPSR
jgi:outer membrane protein OmpA-like peptidoglycan-associated protein